MRLTVARHCHTITVNRLNGGSEKHFNEKKSLKNKLETSEGAKSQVCRQIFVFVSQFDG